MASKDFFQCEGDFAYGCFGAGGGDTERQKIGIASCAFCQGIEGSLHRLRVALGFQPVELVDLCRSHGGIVHFQNIDGTLVECLETVDPDHRLIARINARLCFGCGFLDTQFRDARLDGFCHAAELFDFLHMLPRAGSEIMRQPLDII